MVYHLSSGAQAELTAVLAQAKAAHPLERVMRLAGLRPKRGEGGRAVANCPSPAHPSRSASLRVNLAGPGSFNCGACGAWGDALDFIGLAHGVSYLAAQYELLTGAALEFRVDQRYADEIRGVTGAGRRDEIEGTVAPDEVADATYVALLERLTLSGCHRDSPLIGGFTDDALALKNFKSLPLGPLERVRLCEGLAAEGHDLALIPGFFRAAADSPDARRRGRWCVGGGGGAAGRDTGGMLVPIRSPSGRIARLALYSELPAHMGGPWPSVSVLSSLGRWRSPSGGAAGVPRVHYAGPVDGGSDPGVLYVVDGALTAEVVARDWDVRVAGLPGLGRCVDEALEDARKFTAVDFVIDGVDNPHVDGMCRKAHARGLAPLYHFWDLRRGGTFNAYLISGRGEAVVAGTRVD